MKIPFKIDWPMESNKLNNKAYQKPETPKPSISLSPIKMITALITKRNNPNVIIVTGIVKNTNTGFKNVFNKASTMATIRAVEKRKSRLRKNTISPQMKISTDGWKILKIIEYWW